MPPPIQGASKINTRIGLYLAVGVPTETKVGDRLCGVGKLQVLQMREFWPYKMWRYRCKQQTS